MPSETDDEERQQRRLSFLLLKKAGERKFTPIGREEATQLLGQLESVYMGLGSSNLLVPKEALTAAGVDTQVWEKADLREVRRKGKDYFEVPSLMADLGFMPVLRVLSKGVEAEMAQIEKTRGTGTRPGKPKER